MTCLPYTTIYYDLPDVSIYVLNSILQRFHMRIKLSWTHEKLIMEQ